MILSSVVPSSTEETSSNSSQYFLKDARTPTRVVIQANGTMHPGIHSYWKHKSLEQNRTQLPEYPYFGHSALDGIRVEVLLEPTLFSKYFTSY
jgi:hypothetical protein